MRNRWIRVAWMCLLTAVIVTCCSCEGVNLGGGDEEVTPTYVYSKYNIHYYLNKGKYYGSYANYVEPLEHGFLPYNTKLEIGKYRGGFKVIAADSGMEINVQYKSSNMAGMSKDVYIETITSPTPVSYSFSSQEQDNIEKGRVENGMSKDAVMVSWGYPAKHKTPSLDDNAWTFWKDRFRTIKVMFGADGKVSNVVR